MSNLKSFITKRPALSAISITIIWFVVIMISTGIATSALKRDFGDPTTSFLGHLVGIIFVLTLLWRFGWLKSAGISQLGKYKVWCISILGTVYFTLASLYSFYGNLRFDVSNLTNFSYSGNIINAGVANCMGEEIIFRGAFLYILIRCWGDTIKGRISSVVLTSGIFALFHILHVVFYGHSLTATLLLVLEGFIISIWWASMVLKSGSIWPAFLAHFIVNTAVALQSNTQTINQPDFQIYLKLLLFSLPLGIIGIWMIIKMPDKIENIT
jgi:membrane protease YdiL (CAAX protease family)